MTFNHFTRRLHLYLAMSLLPWFLMYGVSSLQLSHGAYFQKLYGPEQRVVQFDRPYSIDIPPNADLKKIGRKILDDNGMRGDFGTYMPNNRQLLIYMPNFISPTEVKYLADEKRVVASSPPFHTMQLLTRMHVAGGFNFDSLGKIAWGVIVDIVCLGFLLWIASGIYMWWKLPQTRFWGWLSLGQKSNACSPAAQALPRASCQANPSRNVLSYPYLRLPLQDGLRH